MSKLTAIKSNRNSTPAGRRGPLAGGRGPLAALRVLAACCAGLTTILVACGGGAEQQGTPVQTQLLATSVERAAAKHLYVSQLRGSDSNSGDRATPFLTIQRAATVAGPGTTVHVAPGTYAENIISRASGSASSRIVYVSDAPLLAKIVPAPGSQNSTLWQVKGGYTDIVGFDISATGSASTRVGIDFTGGYSSAKNNHVHDIGKLPLLCGTAGGAGIRSASDPDVNGHTDVIANTVHDIGQGNGCKINGIYLATSGTIKNNLIHNVGFGAVLLWHDNRNIDIVNNTIFGSMYGIVYGSGDQVYSQLPADDINVANNIIYDNRVGIHNYGMGTLGAHNTFTNNLVFNNATNWITATPHTGDINADPQFVNYVRSGGGDYRLKSTSPAIDSGASDRAPSTDLAGNRRPQGAGPDVGALEFCTDTPVPPPPTPGTAHELYVNLDKGDDGNPGTQDRPFKTIQRGANAAKPDTTIHVAPGVYAGNVTTTVHGSATGRIRYVSDTKWGAKIIGTGTEFMWTNKGNYTDIVGFDISGPGREGIMNMGSHTLIQDNHVHDLAISGGCTGGGGAGINNGNYSGTDGDIIGNVVHDIGVRGRCSGVQGIYHAYPRGRIYNNVVYRASSWGIHLWHAADKVLVANNTVFANGSAGMGGGIVIGVGNAPGGRILSDTKVVNNIVFNNPYHGIHHGCDSGFACIGSGNIIAANLVCGSSEPFTKGGVLVPSGTVSADPQFVNYQTDGSGNYRLKRSSPAVDHGGTTWAPAQDIDNIVRPRGGAHDLGAYENY